MRVASPGTLLPVSRPCSVGAENQRSSWERREGGKFHRSFLETPGPPGRPPGNQTFLQASKVAGLKLCQRVE
eukprot:3821074-Prorocentrum_lima.AAC.1